MTNDSETVTVQLRLFEKYTVKNPHGLELPIFDRARYSPKNETFTVDLGDELIIKADINGSTNSGYIVRDSSKPGAPELFLPSENVSDLVVWHN